jgi:uncharacterized protein
MLKKISLLLLLILPLILAVDLPELKGFVTDNADIISSEDETRIINLIDQIEQETTAEIVVVTVKSLEGLSKEQYALELAEKNGIGKEDKDNGLLILVALDEREYRFEVGYGLEGSIPDASKVNIGTKIIEPNFRQGEFGKGIYESLIVMNGMIQNDPEVISEFQRPPVQGNRSTIKLIFFILFWGIIIFSLISRRRSRSGFLFFPIFLPGSRGGFSGGSGGFGSSGFGGGSFGGGGFGGGW